LPAALQSIRDQQYADWELVVVDDGSTDDTPAVVRHLSENLSGPLRYIQQENQGAYGARNTGLDHARGKYVAFFDSDDQWLPHHLQDCVDALDSHGDVDWVYGASRIIDGGSNRVLAENAFYVDGAPRPFMRLKHRRRGALCVIEDDEATCCMILHGLYCGLQNSVLRRSLLQGFRFESDSRNEAEDQLFAIRALAAKWKIAYLDNVHVLYTIHDGNSSAAGSGDLERRCRVLTQMAESYEQMLSRDDWPPRERCALRRRLLQDYFWLLGYATLWTANRRSEAMRMFRRGLRHWPWDWRCWKTYAVAKTKCLASLR
jgi:cellulose synthase/poly-beta-1,6-N-acetylglucosamine synthase-like glycosyltransferase